MVLLERSRWVGFNGIYLVRLGFKMWEILIFKWFLLLKIQINSNKPGFLEGKNDWGRGNPWTGPNGTGHTPVPYLFIVHDPTTHESPCPCHQDRIHLMKGSKIENLGWRNYVFVLWARFRTHPHFLSDLCHVVLKWSEAALWIPRNSCQLPFSQNHSHNHSCAISVVVHFSPLQT
jgi:hypothetical protein